MAGATTSGIEVVDLLCSRRGIGQLIENSEIGSIAAGNMVSVAHLRRASFGTDHFRNPPLGPTTIARFGNATGVADDYRDAGDLTASSGTLAVDANWADTTLGTEDIYHFYHGIHPLWIIEAMNKALRDVYFTNVIPLTLAADGDMQASNTTSWGTAVNASAAKQTTASRVFSGMRSMAVTNSSGNGYIPTANIAVDPGDELFVAGISRLNSGTSASLVLYDVTNAATFGTAVTHSSPRHTFMLRDSDRAPSGCRNINVRLLGTGSADVVDWSALWVYVIEDNRVYLPSSIVGRYSITGVSVASFEHDTGTNTYSAPSIEPEEIEQGAYRIQIANPEANNAFIQFFDRRWLARPLYLQIRRPHIEIDGPFTRVLTETTTADRDLFEALTAVHLLSDKRVQMPDKDNELAKANDDLTKQRAQHKTETPARQRTPHGWGGSLRN